MKYFVSILIVGTFFWGNTGSVFAGLVLSPADQTPTVQNGNQTPTVQPGDRTPTVHSNPIGITNPIAADNIIELFNLILDILLVFAVPLIAFFIIYAGFLYVTAQGNAEK